MIMISTKTNVSSPFVFMTRQPTTVTTNKQQVLHSETQQSLFICVSLILDVCQGGELLWETGMLGMNEGRMTE